MHIDYPDCPTWNSRKGYLGSQCAYRSQRFFLAETQDMLSLWYKAYLVSQTGIFVKVSKGLPLGIIIFYFQTLQPTYIVWDKDLCLVIQHDLVIISKKDCYLVHIPTRPAPAPRVHALNFASFYLTRTQYFTYMYMYTLRW